MAETGLGFLRKCSSLAEIHEALPRSFYNRATISVARALLGKVLRLGDCAARIVETEAYLDRYRGEIDAVAHSSRGRTPRTQVIFGPPGHAYVYLSYGIHECLNVVAEPEGKPGCVLIRALEPVAGIAEMRRRRGRTMRDRNLANGPGKLTQAMGITRELYGADLVCGPLTVHEPEQQEPVRIGVSSRVGITRCADWPLRFFIEGNPFVSRK